MSEKQCPSCKMMIDKEASVCPHCRRKFGLTLPAKLFLGFIVLTLFGYIISQSNKSSTTDKNSSNTSVTSTPVSTRTITKLIPAQEKQLVPFKFVGTYQNYHSLLVPRSTTAEQLTDLIAAIVCHRRVGKLNDIGIPPTNLSGGKIGPYDVIAILFFKDPDWASVDKLARWLKAGNGDSFYAKFGQHIKAYYLYSMLNHTEEASLGYAEDGRPYNRDYKPITPVNLAQCNSTKYGVANLSNTDELQALLTSKFAKQFELQKKDSWALSAGGQNIQIFSKKLPSAKIELVQKQKELTEYHLAFQIGYSMGEPEWNFIKKFIEQILTQDSSSKALTFVKQHINNPIIEKKDPSTNPGTFARSSYPSQQLKGFTIRAGKHVEDPTLIIEKNIKF